MNWNILRGGREMGVEESEKDVGGEMEIINE
jgi:hypothetical protein